MLLTLVTGRSPPNAVLATWYAFTLLAGLTSAMPAIQQPRSDMAKPDEVQLTPVTSSGPPETRLAQRAELPRAFSLCKNATKTMQTLMKELWTRPTATAMDAVLKIPTKMMKSTKTALDA